MNKGFIKLYRKMQDWEWYTHPTTFRLFIHLLIIAEWEGSRFRGIEIGRGQALRTERKLAEELFKNKTKRQPIRTALKNLVATQEITITKTLYGSLITINNYDEYQGLTQDLTQDTTQDSTKSNPRPNHSSTQSKETKDIRTKETIYSQLQKSYNEICTSLPKCTRITDQRKQMIDARLKDYSLDDFKKVFELTQASDFLSGRSGAWTNCNFDWLIRPNNFVKVIERTYNKNKKDEEQRKGFLSG